MKKFKIILVLILVLGIIFSFSGCTVEVYQRLIIKAVGVDVDEQGLVLTIRTVNLEDEKETNLTVRGDSTYQALSSLSLQSGKKQMYSHNGSIVFGSNVSDLVMKDTLDFFIRYFKSHSRIKLFRAENTAEEIITAKTDDEIIPADKISYMCTSQENIGWVMNVEIIDFINTSFGEGQIGFMPVLKYSDDRLHIKGNAIFYNYQYQNILDNDQTMTYLAAVSKLKESELTLDTEQYGKVSCQLYNDSGKTEIDVDKKEVDININLNASIASITLGKSVELSDFKEIEKLLIDKIKSNLDELIQKSYGEGCDIFFLYKNVYLKNTDKWRELEPNWNSLIKDLKFNYNIKCHINRLGEENRPSN